MPTFGATVTEHKTAALVEVQQVNDRLDALRLECVRQKDLIYRGEGVQPREVLPFLDRVISLTLTFAGHRLNGHRG